MSRPRKQLVDASYFDAFKTINDPGVPFYSLIELRNLVLKLIEHLRINEDAIIETGFCPKRFSSSLWLDNKLTYLYYTQWKPVRAFVTDKTGKKIFLNSMSRADDPQVWLKDNCTCDIPEKRRLLFKVKIKSLQLIAKNLKSNKLTGKKLITDFFQIVKHHLTYEDVQYFFTLDRAFSFHNFSSGRKTKKKRQRIFPGGFSELLSVVFHVAEEIEIGCYDYFRKNIQALPKNIWNPQAGSQPSFGAIAKKSTPADKKMLDNVLLDFRSKQIIYRKWMADFRRKFNTFLKNEISRTVTFQFALPPSIAQKFKRTIKKDAQNLQAQLLNNSEANISSSKNPIVIFSDDKKWIECQGVRLNTSLAQWHIIKYMYVVGMKKYRTGNSPATSAKEILTHLKSHTDIPKSNNAFGDYFKTSAGNPIPWSKFVSKIKNNLYQLAVFPPVSSNN